MSDSHRHVPLQNATTDAQRADQLLTVADVAGRIGAHEQTVRRWIKSSASSKPRGSAPGSATAPSRRRRRGLPAPAHPHRLPSPPTSSGPHRRRPTPERHRRCARRAGQPLLSSTFAHRGVGWHAPQTALHPAHRPVPSSPRAAFCSGPWRTRRRPDIEVRVLNAFVGIAAIGHHSWRNHYGRAKIRYPGQDVGRRHQPTAGAARAAREFAGGCRGRVPDVGGTGRQEVWPGTSNPCPRDQVCVNLRCGRGCPNPDDLCQASLGATCCPANTHCCKCPANAGGDKAPVCAQYADLCKGLVTAFGECE